MNDPTIALDAASFSNRQHWLGSMAKAPDATFDRIWNDLEPHIPDHEPLRRPETGLVMVRGRTGGTGNAFNLGEMTVTRASVRLADGTIGHGYIAGRKPDRAQQIALLDAVFQNDSGLAERAVATLDAAIASGRNKTARKAAATKVDFFTMVRGEG